MKIPSNFRLDAGIKFDLQKLAEVFRTSQTNVVQLAIREFWVAHIKEPLNERKGL